MPPFVISVISAVRKPLLLLILSLATVGLACAQPAPVPATPVGIGGGPIPTATYPGGARPGSLAVGPVSPETGKQLFSTKTCVACHTVASVPGAVGEVGPKLDGIGDTSKHPKIATGQDQPCQGCAVTAGIDNNPDGLKRWLSNPPGVKPGTQMPNLSLSAREIDSLILFLQTLK